MKAFSIPAIASALAALFFLSSVASSSERSVIFDEDQVNKGRTSYFSHCADCHGYDLIKLDDEATNLTGDDFVRNWVGQSIGQRYRQIRSSMPPSAPNSLGEQEVLDIIAFVLHANKYPSGQKTLTPDLDLDSLEITAR